MKRHKISRPLLHLCSTAAVASSPILLGARGCDLSGLVTERDEECSAEYAPVCGADQTTYGNACEADRAGVDIIADGACEELPPSCPDGTFATQFCDEFGCYPQCEPIAPDPRGGGSCAADLARAEFDFPRDEQSCEGPQYIRFSEEQQLWVGVVDCGDGSVRLYLAESAEGPFLPALDGAGHGQDHCELIAPGFYLTDEDDINSGSCTECSTGPNLPIQGAQGYARHVLGETFEFVAETPEWNLQTSRLSCGCSVSGESPVDPDPTSACIDDVSRWCADAGLDQVACDEQIRASCFPAEDPTSECINAVSIRCAEEGLDQVACDEALRATCGLPTEEPSACSDAPVEYVCVLDRDFGGPVSYPNRCEAEIRGFEILADRPCGVAGDPSCPEGYTQTGEDCDAAAFEEGARPFACFALCQLDILVSQERGSEEGAI
jgi:hypothetical protein